MRHRHVNIQSAPINTTGYIGPRHVRSYVSIWPLIAHWASSNIS
jgi:hypothetical protein